MIKVYRKTATIKAERFDGSEEMIEKYRVRTGTDYTLSDDLLEIETIPYQIETLEGWLTLGVGDWIATGIDGEHRTIKDDVFKRTYAELPVIPKEAAEWIEECKNDQNYSLGDLLYDSLDYPGNEWIYNNSEKVARAWLDGYQVEEDNDAD